MSQKHSSKSVEHYTPVAIIEAARQVLGGIDLDPASCAVVNEQRVRAGKYFDEASDGLAHPWEGRVFLNPPGGKTAGKSNAVAWWRKLREEYASGRVAQAILVAFSLELLQTAQEGGAIGPIMFPFCVPRRRLAYDTLAGDAFVAGKNPPGASAIIYLRAAHHHRDLERFAHVFSKFGAVRL